MSQARADTLLSEQLEIPSSASIGCIGVMFVCLSVSVTYDQAAADSCEQKLMWFKILMGHLAA